MSIFIYYNYREVELFDSSTKIAFNWEGKDYRYQINTKKNKKNAWTEIVELFQSASCISVIEKALNDIRGETSCIYYDELFRNGSDISVLDNDLLVTIGAHNHEHLPLRYLEKEDAKFQIIESKRLLESKLGHPVEHFSYSFGTKNEVSIRDIYLVKESGFKTAVIAKNKSFYTNGDIYSLPRQAVSFNDTIDTFKVKLSGWNAYFGIN